MQSNEKKKLPKNDVVTVIALSLAWSFLPEGFKNCKIVVGLDIIGKMWQI